ncbi:uncharacterized protein LOC108441534 [Pygocentrus nattereri]|uniref:uncharacterized protein LOC108441534 n=1 Tax=Pygocentrus nattereri TaxID=42514 RepID=UPI0008142597|nr:uncharacterized protein LOC108441534 [Pygocentrus nattereri]
MSKAHVYLYVLVALSCVYGVMCVDGANSTTRATTSNSANTSQSQGTDPTHHSYEDYPSTVTTNPTKDGNNNSDAVLDNGHNSSTTEEDHTNADITTTTVSQTTSENVTSSRPDITSGVSTITKASTTPVGKTEAASGGSAQGIGVAFLIIILIIVIALAVILYVLWKKGRSYSFDLTYTGNDHDTPLRSMEHGGVFEQTSKELSAAEYDQEEKPHETNSTANGCAGETPKQAASSEQQNMPEEDSFMSDTSLTPPMKKVDFNLDLDLIGGELEPKAEPSDPQQNENNNNFTSTGNDTLDLFTEINLDEPQ